VLGLGLAVARESVLASVWVEGQVMAAESELELVLVRLLPSKTVRQQSRLPRQQSQPEQKCFRLLRPAERALVAIPNSPISAVLFTMLDVEGASRILTRLTTSI
jgi:hypothetical protein